MEQPAQWQSYLPFIVIALVFVLRLRHVNRERRMHPGRLLVAPSILLLFAAGAFATIMPGWTGLAIGAGGVAVGAGVGWQRARLMKIAYDPTNDIFTTRQSPIALAFLIAIMVLRRLVLHAAPVAGAAMPRALWPVDGLIGFGLAMVTVHNVELWRRARKLRRDAA